MCVIYIYLYKSIFNAAIRSNSSSLLLCNFLPNLRCGRRALNYLWKNKPTQSTRGLVSVLGQPERPVETAACSAWGHRALLGGVLP